MNDHDLYRHAADYHDPAMAGVDAVSPYAVEMFVFWIRECDRIDWRRLGRRTLAREKAVRKAYEGTVQP